MKTYIITLILLIVLFQNRSSGQCDFNDISLYPAYSDLAKSVVAIKIPFTSNGKTLYAYGTGVLVNNTNIDGTPYIITAAHLIDLMPKNDQIEPEEIALLNNAVFRFNFQTGGTSFEVIGSTHLFSSLFKNSNNRRCRDLMLIKLNSTLNGKDVFFAGWNATMDFQTQSTTTNLPLLIHHPGFLSKKISFVSTFETITGDCTDYYSKFNFSGKSGTGEGSSGASYYDNNTGLVFAILSGPSANECTFTANPEIGTNVIANGSANKVYSMLLVNYWSNIKSYLDPLNKLQSMPATWPGASPVDFVFSNKSMNYPLFKSSLKNLTLSGIQKTGTGGILAGKTITISNSTLKSNMNFFVNNIGTSLLGASQPLKILYNDTALAIPVLQDQENSFRIFPNPFNSSTSIICNLNESGKVNIIIYDMLGNKVKEICNHMIPAGENRFNFSSENLNSGIYFCKLIIEGKETLTKRMMIQK